MSPCTRSLAAAAVVSMLAIAGCANGGTPGANPGTPQRTPASSAGQPSATPTRASSPTPTSTATVVGTPSPTSTSKPAKVVQRNPGWALDRIDQRRLPFDKRYISQGEGEGVTVYVIDGLFDVKNPEFEGRASVGLNVGERCVLEDGIDHGLFVAGLVGGRHTGSAKKTNIVAVGYSYGCEGAEEVSDTKIAKRIVRAVNWVADNASKPAVVNLSLNAEGKQPELTAAIKRLTDAGLTVVASAGNGGVAACGHRPAGLPDVITVTGSTKSDEDAGLNYGRCVDLYAPAEGVTSVVDQAISSNRRARSDQAATSWAAPLVSGVAALYLSSHPEASPQQVRRWLIDNATKDAIQGDRRGTPNRLVYSGGPR